VICYERGKTFAEIRYCLRFSPRNLLLHRLIAFTQTERIADPFHNRRRTLLGSQQDLMRFEQKTMQLRRSTQRNVPPLHPQKVLS
jgi:hypothetical protein